MFASKDTLLTRPSGGYTIARSVRLRSSASAYLNRTLTTPTNNQKWTYSCWIKRGSVSNNSQGIFESPSSGSTFASIYFTSGDIINWYEASGGATVYILQTSQVFRDPSAWYHLVCVYDSTQATSSNRQKMYVNGVQITAFSTASYVAQNTNGRINSAVAHKIGTFDASSNYLDGYLTEINFIDGQALTPSSFGETDSITGVWKPKAYSGTYGTNGFYLNFSDNSNNTATTIGKDYSGNGNNWTPNNISVTAGVTYDSMTDVPTLTSATAANYCVMNPLSDLSVTLSEGNLKGLTIINNANTRCNSTIAVSSGKWYFETYLGVAGTNTAVGIGQNNITDQYPANDALSFAQEIDNARKGNNNTFTSYGTALVAGDIFMCAFDLDNNKIFFGKNGTWFNSSDPAAGTSPAFTLTAGLYTPIFRPYGNTSGYIQVNFGQRPFSYTPPTGYVALNTYNLPASTIKNGAAYMAATTWTSAGGTETISNAVNGVSFQPDFLWMKNRSIAQNNYLVDSNRGTSKILVSNTTSAEATDATFVTAFNSNGFSLGSGGFTATQAIVGWQWKAGGTSSSNTNGSITSTVSVGATQGFSVVTYTGNGSSSATVGHGLGVVPSMIINKTRNSGTVSWFVKHTSLASNLMLTLDTTDGTYNGSLAGGGGLGNLTSSTTFGFVNGTSNVNNVNASGGTYVAYCFAAVAGYSAFGSYTGNGSTDGPFVYTGFRPRFVLWKRITTAGGHWGIIDSGRNTYNLANLSILANASDGDATNVQVLDLVSNGFKIRTSDGGQNLNADTFIYAAFAENPFKNSLAR